MLCVYCCAPSQAQSPDPPSRADKSAPRPARLPVVKLSQADNVQLNVPPFTQADSVSRPSTSGLSADGSIRLVAGETVLVPIVVEPPAANVDIAGEQGLVTLEATGAELTAVLRMIADHHGLNLVVGPEVGGPVTVSIRGARLEEVLDAILGVAGCVWHRVDNLLYVTGAAATGMDPRVQGRTLQVYPLNYVSATDVEAVANGLLSPVGNAYVNNADPADQLRTREVLVVEDTLAAHQRIAQYIAQIDTVPRQVLIEAHVLQVSLTDEERHGINLRGWPDSRAAKLLSRGLDSLIPVLANRR